MNKIWSHRAKKIGLALLRGVVCTLVLLSFLLTVLSFTAKATIGQREGYRRIVRDPAVTQALLNYAWADLEAECLFYGLPTDIIDEALSEEEAAAFSLQYIDAVYEAVFVSGKLVSPTVDAALFRAPIAARLAEEEIEDKDTVIDQLAAEFAAVTTAVWRLGINQKILTPLHRVLTNVWVVRLMNGGLLLAAITALLLGVGIVTGLRRIRRQVFALSGTLTVGSMILFVPFWLLHRYGLAEKLVLGDSPLRLFVVRWLNAVTAQLSATTMWVLVACAATTLIAAVWVVWPKREKAAPVSIDWKENQESVSSEES